MQVTDELLRFKQFWIGHMNQKKDQKTKTGYRWKRDLIEWGLLLLVPLVLYLTGLHTEVLGRMQQALLWTGVLQPDTELAATEREPADYDMPLVTLDGERTSLEAFRGKVIFLNFWATWCPPCIAEMPNIQDLYHSMKGHGDIAFVMVSLDESAQKAREFISRKEFDFPVYQLAAPRPAVFRTAVVPTTFVVDKQGTIIAKREGMANYNTASFKIFLNQHL